MARWRGLKGGGNGGGRLVPKNSRFPESDFLLPVAAFLTRRIRKRASALWRPSGLQKRSMGRWVQRVLTSRQQRQENTKAPPLVRRRPSAARRRSLKSPSIPKRESL